MRSSNENKFLKHHFPRRPWHIYFIILIFVLILGIWVGNEITVRSIKAEIGEYRDLVKQITMVDSRKTDFILQYKDQVLKVNPKLSDRELTLILSYLFDNIERSKVLYPGLCLAWIQYESGFNPRAVSVANAKGLTQIIDPTGKLIASALGRPDYDLFDIKDNIDFGCYFLALCIESYGERKGLAIYNAGLNFELGIDYANVIIGLKNNWEGEKL